MRNTLNAVYIDRLDYYIDNVQKIIGILVKMVNSGSVKTRTATTNR